MIDPRITKAEKLEKEAAQLRRDVQLARTYIFKNKLEELIEMVNDLPDTNGNNYYSKYDIQDSLSEALDCLEEQYGY